MRYLINWGSYDVDNFGDLLFPYIIDEYMSAYYEQIVHVSPTGIRSRLKHTKQSISISDAMGLNSRDTALIIGGGNLISWTTSSSRNYGESPDIAKTVHPSFFYIPMILKHELGIPFAFNRVGVSKPIPDKGLEGIRNCGQLCSYMSVRDFESKNRLVKAKVDIPIDNGIDTAIGIPNIFSKRYLQDRFRALVNGLTIPMDTEIAVVHLKKRYFDDDLSSILCLIQQLNRNNIHPLFVPLGICHGDDIFLKSLNLERSRCTVFSEPDSLLDLVAIVANTKYYFGSSLHGAIASLAYGNNAVIVANERDSRFCKFSGFLNQVNQSDKLFDSWAELVSEISKNGVSRSNEVPSQKSLHNDLQKHFEKIENSLRNRETAKASEAHLDELFYEIKSIYSISNIVESPYR